MARRRIHQRKNLTVALPAEAYQRLETLAGRWMIDRSDVVRIAVGDLLIRESEATAELDVPPAMKRAMARSEARRGKLLTIDELFGV